MDRGTWLAIVYGVAKVKHDLATEHSISCHGLSHSVYLPAAAATAAKSLQSCPTLCDPMDGSPPVPGILQARILEWVTISLSNA